MFGAILFSVPNVLHAFVENILQLAVLVFLQGIGIGLMFTIGDSNMNTFFDKKRIMVIINLFGLLIIIIKFFYKKRNFKN